MRRFWRFGRPKTHTPVCIPPWLLERHHSIVYRPSRWELFTAWLFRRRPRPTETVYMGSFTYEDLTDFFGPLPLRTRIAAFRIRTPQRYADRMGRVLGTDR